MKKKYRRVNLDETLGSPCKHCLQWPCGEPCEKIKWYNSMMILGRGKHSSVGDSTADVLAVNTAAMLFV